MPFFSRHNNYYQLIHFMGAEKFKGKKKSEIFNIFSLTFVNL